MISILTTECQRHARTVCPKTSPSAQIPAILAGKKGKACPSGDTDYEVDYSKAISDAMPIGFEVQRQRLNEKWAIDSEGFTLIPLRLTDERASLAYWINKCAELKRRIEPMRNVAKSISE